MTADLSQQPDRRKDANGNDGLARLLDHVADLAPVRAAIVHPCDALSLAAALDVRDAGLVEPVLVAPRARLDAAAEVLVAHPRIGPARDDIRPGLRYLISGSYLLLYRIVGEDEIEIVRVTHGRRDLLALF